MSEIDYQALREAAEKATKGRYIVGHASVNQHRGFCLSKMEGRCWRRD